MKDPQVKDCLSEAAGSRNKTVCLRVLCAPSGDVTVYKVMDVKND